MADYLYRDTAIELYVSEIKRMCPDMDEHMLESMKLAFFSGFNMGMVYFEGKEVKEQALKMMVSY